MTLLLIFFFISILFSFLCSIWEAVLLSVTASHIENLKKDNVPAGAILANFKDNIDRPLAAILTLNTIAHTVGAIGVGAQAGKIWGGESWNLLGIPLNVEAVIAALMTLAILILSEIIPKTIGANQWRALAGFTARSVQLVIYILLPLVWLAQWITKSMKKDANKSVFSRRDLSALASIGVKSGRLNEDEFHLLENVLAFRSVKVEEVMTPRTVLVRAPEKGLIGKFNEEHPKLLHSRIPLYKSTVDEISHYFLKNDLLQAIIDKREADELISIARPMLFIGQDDSISHALETMVQKQEHILRVVDGFGGTAGIITMEDVIETLLGLEILDEVDVTADMQELARKRWEERVKSKK
jgi:CBS domain containing-hemolysin-like protein